jgi:hypothetical protein
MQAFLCMADMLAPFWFGPGHGSVPDISGQRHKFARGPSQTANDGRWDLSMEIPPLLSLQA